jgi:hypothetical protein
VSDDRLEPLEPADEAFRVEMLRNQWICLNAYTADPGPARDYQLRELADISAELARRGAALPAPPDTLRRTA